MYDLLFVELEGERSPKCRFTAKRLLPGMQQGEAVSKFMRVCVALFAELLRRDAAQVRVEHGTPLTLPI